MFKCTNTHYNKCSITCATAHLTMGPQAILARFTFSNVYSGLLKYLECIFSLTSSLQTESQLHNRCVRQTKLFLFKKVQTIRCTCLCTIYAITAKYRKPGKTISTDKLLLSDTKLYTSYFPDQAHCKELQSYADFYDVQYDSTITTFPSVS